MSITEHIFHPVVNAVGWTVIHSLWQFALIALLWRLAMYLARKSSPVLRYNISLLALFAIPASFVYTFIRQWHVYRGARQIVSLEFDTSAWIAAGGDRVFYILDRGHPAFLERLDAYSPLVFWIYTTGILLFSLHAILSYSALYILKTKHSHPLPEQWQRTALAVKQRARIKRRLRIKASSKISIPLVTGFFSPMVLLPAAMLFSMTTEQIEAILLHELHHIRRGDHYVNFIQCLTEILFFYHPASWWINKRIRMLREECVDQWVVDETGCPLTYAKALVTLEENRDGRMLQPVLAATQSKNQLFSRIKNMMTMKTRSITPGQKMAAILAIGFALASIAWINPVATINISDNDLHYLAEDTYQQYSIPSAVDEVVEPDNRALSGQAVTDEETTTRTLSEQTATDQSPGTIHLHDGSTIDFEALSGQEQEKIRQAMKELQLAMKEVNKEVFERLHDEEFRMQLQEAGEEVRIATQEAGEEIQKAMEELRLQLQDEEFRKEMHKAREEIRQAMKELDAVDWKAIGQEIDKAMQEVNKSMEYIGPVLQEIMEGLGQGLKEMGAGLENLGPAIQEMFKEIERSAEEPAEDE